MVVLKFGGTSVRDPQMIRAVVAIAESRLSESPVLVSSAMGSTTDDLVEIARLASSGDHDGAFDVLEQLAASHRVAAEELAGSATETVLSRLNDLLSELEGLVQGVFLIRECSPRSADAILSFGERMSTLIITAAAAAAGVSAELVDARTVIRTSSDFGAADPDMEKTAKMAGEAITPRPGHLYVTQGFVGSNENGVTTTLGRGGSDFSATILGAVLGAGRVEIWTDVDGIMTSDPRVIENATTLASVTYEEAAELAYFGARVVHPSTIVPAVDRGIPVFVKNTRYPDRTGTRIQGAPSEAGVRAIASKSGITLVTIRSSRMLNAYGFLSAIFAVFARHRIPVDLVATSEVSVSMTLDRSMGQAALEELQELGDVSVEPGRAIVCLVGRDSFRDPGLLSRAFGSLGDLDVRMISLGSSDINLSIVVSDDQRDEAVKLLHRELLEADTAD